jgi:hypothetical protein
MGIRAIGRKGGGIDQSVYIPVVIRFGQHEDKPLSSVTEADVVTS